MTDAPVVRFAAVDPELDPSPLTAYELGRRDRLLRAEDRAAYVAAHLLVRECVAELLAQDAPPRLAAIRISQACPDCGPEPGHGAPFVVDRRDVHISLSHSHDHVAAAAAWAPIGIDVESTGGSHDPVDSALTRREAAWVTAQPDPQRAFLSLWVRKEALIKRGDASLDDLARLDVLAADGLGPDETRFAQWSTPDAIGAWTLS